MKPLRILILTNRVPYPLHDGGALAMDALIRGYHEAGVAVRLLAMNTTRHLVDEAVLHTLYPELDGFEAVQVNNDVTAAGVLKNLLFSKDPEHAARFYHTAFAERLKKTLEAFSPDIVQLESPFLTAYFPLIKSSKTVLRVHNAEYQIWGRLAAATGGMKGRYLKILAKRMRRYEASIWSKYDLLLPITETDAAQIRALHPAQQMLVAPYGIEPEAGIQACSSFRNAYHLGAMDWLPNEAAMDWLLGEIWPQMAAAVPGAQFTFGGRNMPARFRHNLPEGVQCAGEVADVRSFLHGQDVLIVPLRAGGGIRIKILEAMAAGKLVISTSVGMQGIDAVPGVHYLEANSADEFATAFGMANMNAEHAALIIRNAGQLIAERYSNRAIVCRILEAFEALLTDAHSS